MVCFWARSSIIGDVRRNRQTREHLNMTDKLLTQPRTSNMAPTNDLHQHQDDNADRGRHSLVLMLVLSIISIAMLSVASAQMLRDSGLSATAQGTVISTGQYVVARGDSLFGIARRFGVSLDQLQAWNDLTGSGIVAGQRLRLSADAPSSSIVNATQTHTVQRGDTAFGIAKRYGISLNALVRLNSLDSNFTLSVGQVLQISTAPDQSADVETTDVPLPGQQTQAATPSGGVLATAGALVAAPTVVESTSQAQQDEPASVETTTIQLARRRLSEPEAPSASDEVLLLPSNPGAEEAGRRFIWPVRGRLLSGFGPQEGGLVNDGINIAVRTGEDVRAAASGKVIFASDRFNALGNLILIEHRDSWVTAYAHNDQMLVQRGDRVQQGQVIALAGSSGTVDRSQLHFEIRQDGTPVNPLNFLQF